MESFSFTTAGRLEETLDYLAKMLLKKTLCQPAAGQQNFTKQASKPLHIEKLEFLISLAVLDANYDTRRI